MSVAAATVADLVKVQNGTPAVMVGFKARQAIHVAHEQLAPGAINIAQQTALYSLILAKAIVNESNR